MLRHLFVVALVLVVCLSVGVLAAEEPKPRSKAGGRTRQTPRISSPRAIRGRGRAKPVGSRRQAQRRRDVRVVRRQVRRHLPRHRHGPPRRAEEHQLDVVRPRGEGLHVLRRGQQGIGRHIQRTGSGRTRGPGPARASQRQVLQVPDGSQRDVSDLYTFKAEVSEDGVKWAVIDEGSRQGEEPQK